MGLCLVMKLLGLPKRETAREGGWPFCLRYKRGEKEKEKRKKSDRKGILVPPFCVLQLTGNYPLFLFLFLTIVENLGNPSLGLVKILLNK